MKYINIKWTYIHINPPFQIAKDLFSLEPRRASTLLIPGASQRMQTQGGYEDMRGAPPEELISNNVKINTQNYNSFESNYYIDGRKNSSKPQNNGWKTYY